MLKKIIPISKGAMFGLDARIALAIFASLSIMVGASLQSVMVRLKAAKIIAYYTEAEKGLGAYLFDVGHNLSTDPVYTAYTLANDLVEDPGDELNWNGPYLPSFKPWYYNHAYGSIKHKDSPGAGTNTNNGTGTFKIVLIEDDYSAPNSWDGPSLADCPSSSSCSYWAYFHSISYFIGAEKNVAYAKYLDEYYDDGDGSNAGRFRWVPAHNYGYMLKLMPML